MPAAEAIHISALNVEVFAAFHKELCDHLGELAAMTRKYPVEVEFRGLRFVFDSEQEIRDTIKHIESMIAQHNAAKR